MLDYTYEKTFKTDEIKIICGVDEAGRGPLCGPVVAAAVILPLGLCIDGLNDSKKLSEKKREQLFDIITKEAIAYAIVEGSVEEINQTNILAATMNAMKKAILQLSPKADFALIDGNIAKDFPVPAMPVVHGDAISPSIAAASILAKVTRDRLCIEMDKQYPMYKIAKHKGYGTKEHMDALREHGAAPEIYRTKFIRFLDDKK